MIKAFIVIFLLFRTNVLALPDVKLLYTRHPNEIVLESVGDSSGTDTDRMVIDVKGTPQSVAYDFDEKKIYWAVRSGPGYADTGIQKANMSGDSKTRMIETVVLKSEGLNVLTGIALDWITGNIYYADGRQMEIGLCGNNGKHCTVLVHDEENQPFRIALCPNKGYMFWTARGALPRSIFRAGMDGSGVVPIVSKSLTLPGSIAVDHHASRLYWADWTEAGGIIGTSDFNGNDRRIWNAVKGSTVVGPVWHVTVSADKIFWVDKKTRTINSCAKINCTHIRTVVKLKNLHVLHDMITVYAGGEPRHRGNPCEDKPCRYICALTRGGYQCLCPEGLTLSLDGRTCEDLGTKVLFGTENGTEVLSVATKLTIDISASVGPSWGVSYDFERGHVYWTRNRGALGHTVYRSNMKGAESKAVVDIGGKNGSIGIAFDWITENIYYANGVHVGVCDYEGENCAVLVNEPEDPPYRIALFPKLGLMYWTTRGLVPSIKRAFMDGSKVMRIVRGTAMTGPVVIDQEESRLYWLDRTDSIETSDLEWRRRRTIRPLRDKLVAVAVIGNRLYWTDGQVIQSCDKRTQMDPKTFVLPQSRNRTLLDMDMIHSGGQPSNRMNHCAGKLCSHLCVLTENYFRCVCPEGLSLDLDGITCTDCEHNDNESEFASAGPSCPKNLTKMLVPEPEINCPEFGCSASGKCLEQSQVCDGVCDCPDGSDEGPGCDASCASLECAFKCHLSPDGPYCVCPAGFRLSTNDSRSCEDIDECKNPNTCLSYCINLNGSYSCEELNGRGFGFVQKSLVATAVVLTLVAGVVIAVASVVGYKYKQAKKILRRLTPEEIKEFLEGNEGAASSALDGAEKAFLLPFKHVLPPDSIIIAHEAVLGSGNFAIVYRGFCGSEAVAIKKSKRTVEIDEFKAVLAEAKIMAYIGEHKHVVKFVGADVSKISERKILLVTELSPYGDLLNFLRKMDPLSLRKQDYVRSATEGNGYVAFGVTAKILMSWCEQIASAMEFLEAKKIIHGDLAARNVLVFKDFVVKVTDFGLSKQLYGNSEYVSKQSKMLPWRWAAPEVLTRLEFSSESDIWSFGVTAWEILSLGREPYQQFFAYGQPFVSYLQDGHRLGQPECADELTFQAIRECWKAERCNRISFATLREFFQDQAQLADYPLNNSEDYLDSLKYLRIFPDHALSSGSVSSRDYSSQEVSL